MRSPTQERVFTSSRSRAPPTSVQTNYDGISETSETPPVHQVNYSGSSSSVSSTVGSSVAGGFLSEQERRASIKAIMTDTSFTDEERRRSIQQIMDGRRRSSMNHLRRSSTGYLSTGDRTQDETSVEEDATDQISPIPSPSGNARRAFKRSYSEPIRSTAIKFDVLNLQEEEPETFPNVAYDIDGKPTGDPKEFEINRPSCDHYERFCSLISPCCGMVFGCRICHDEYDSLCPPIFKVELDEIMSKNGTDPSHVPQKIKLKDGIKAKHSRRGSMSSIMSSISAMGDDLHHNFDRFAVTEVICRQCYTRQSSKTNNCINCNVQFGEYHCDICNLWMKADEEPYHCSACGFCRVGGRDNFEHCFTCGMCIDVNLVNDHNCKAGKYSTNCPVCYEDLFSSRSACHEMPCGHNIHWHCFNQMTIHDIRCPVCKKTATHEDMADVWDGIAMDIALQPLPPEHSRVVDITCNDCEKRDVDRRWHYLGVQCRHCSSFNTSHTIKMSGLDAHSYLAQIEVQEALNNANINSPSS